MELTVELSKETEALNEPPKSDPEPAAPNVSVWLVDDNDRLRTLVAEILGLQGGIVCARHFSSPDELLSTLASKPGPDVILLDVQMGDRNGLDAVRPIKSLTRSTRVLMFTSCFNPEWRERALGDGASGYLLKSDRLETVAARIRCAAEDPIPGSYSRRRARRPVDCSGSDPANQPRMNKPPRLLSRTLGLLRGFWN
jgi:DNA-binding NarL/FixJ family response regulator